MLISELLGEDDGPHAIPAPNDQRWGAGAAWVNAVWDAAQRAERVAVSGDLEGLDRDFLDRLEAASEEVGALVVVSGYRSLEEQARLYNCYLYKRQTGRCRPDCNGNCNPAYAPGQSQHNYGLAADLSTASWQKLPWNVAAKYGLAYTVNKEPWHIEPKGNWKGRKADDVWLFDDGGD